MTGISNVLSGEQEIRDNQFIRENFDARISQTGKIPGTHSLGVQFRTTSVSEDAHVQEKSDNALVALAERFRVFIDTTPNWDELAREDIKNNSSKNFRKMMAD